MSTIKIILVGLAIAVCAAGFWFGSEWWDAHRAGSARYAHFAAGALVIVDQVEVPSSNDNVTNANLRLRVRIFDPANGSERLRKLLNADCMPARGELLWCYDQDSDGKPLVSLRHIADLSTVANGKQLLALHPGLGAGFARKKSAWLDPADDALLIEANDGRFYRISPTLTVEPVATPPRSPYELVSPQTPPVEKAIRFDSGLQRLALTPIAVFGKRSATFEADGAGSRKALTIGAPTTDLAFAPPSRHHSKQAAPAVERSQQTFIDPGFVGRSPSEPLTLSNPDSLLIGYYDSVDPRDRTLTLARVDDKARVLWTAPLKKSEVLAAEVAGSLLVVVQRFRVVGIDLATGAERYNVRIDQGLW